MTISTAFAPALALPLRPTAPRRCAITRRIPVAMRVVGDPERPQDDTREDDSESQLVGGVVPPADFEDNDQKFGAEAGRDTKGVAGIAKEDDLLLGEKPPVIAHSVEVKSVTAEIESIDKKDSQNENIVKLPNPDKGASKAENKDNPTAAADTQNEKTVKLPNPDKSTSKAENKDNATAAADTAKGSEKSEKKDTGTLKTSLKMTPEQLEKAKEARAAATKAAEDRDAKKSEQGKEFLGKAANILAKIGTKSKAIELGETARAKAETLIENTITTGTDKDAQQQEKLKGSAASAAKSIVGAITKGWEGTVAPKIREVLPTEYKEVSNKVLASAAVGLFVAVALLPSLFSGGEGKPKQAAKQKLDAETAMLEKKLQRDKGVASSYSSRSASQKAVFPPEEKLGRTTPSPTNKAAPIESKTEKPPARLPEASKPVPPPQAPPSLPQTSLSTTPKPQAVTPAPVEPVTTTPPPSTMPPKPVETAKPKEVQPPKPVEVTPVIVMTSVSKALGSNASVVYSASFDSLSAEPTIVLEVSKAYHNLPTSEQKRLAQVMLQSARSLGYERVSLIEVGTGVEVAHAGIDVDLEDEAQNLRAQLGSMQKLSDKLAVQNASKEAEIDALNTRLSEEREEFATKQTELEKSVKMLRAENSGLVDDLDDAKAEIAKMPDRMALEERTIEAERKTEKMSDTVEMLSIQLSRARGEEALAKKSQAESIEAANQAAKDKNEAVASVARQIEQAQRAAESRANDRIVTVERDAQASVDVASKRVGEVEERLARTFEESKASAEETKKLYEKQLSDQKESSEKDVQTIQSKYETMLDEVQRRAQAELDTFQKEADRKMAAAVKEAKVFANSVTKERDQALKEAQKVETRAQKAADKAEREKQGLQKRIEMLEAKLSKKAPVQEAEPAAVETPSSR